MNNISINKLFLLSFGGVLALALLISTGVFFWQQQYTEPMACTKEAKLCPDGSTVGRTAPNCEFAKCPEPSSVDTSTWKVYRNERYEFELKYPEEWKVETFTTNNGETNLSVYNIATYEAEMRSLEGNEGTDAFPRSLWIMPIKINGSVEEFIQTKYAIKEKPIIQQRDFPTGATAMEIEYLTDDWPGRHKLILFSNSKYVFELEVFGGTLAYRSDEEERIYQAIINNFKLLNSSVSLDTFIWKIYRNENMGFELQYPANWFIYDEEKWQEDNKVAQCDPFASIESTLILSERDLGRCIGVVLWENWPGEFIVNVGKEWQSFPYVLGKEDAQVVKVSGVVAIKYPFTEKSERPRKQATRIYVQFGGRGYLIEFLQSDKKGGYNPIYDKILSTFKFIK